MHNVLTMTILRRRANITQGEMAEFLGVSQPNVSQWENLERLPVDRLDDIYTVFQNLIPKEIVGISPKDLILPWDKVLIRNALAEPNALQ